MANHVYLECNTILREKDEAPLVVKRMRTIFDSLQLMNREVEFRATHLQSLI